MPDTVEIMYLTLQSGLLVSGNADITLAKSVASGDALSNQRISGRTDAVYLYQGRTDIRPMLGPRYEAGDYVVAEVSVRFPTATTLNPNSGAGIVLRQRVNDFKTTIVSGTWPVSGVPRPFLTFEEWPLSHVNVAKAKLTYRFRFFEYA